jgi:hypothetical protein
MKRQKRFLLLAATLLAGGCGTLGDQQQAAPVQGGEAASTPVTTLPIGRPATPDPGLVLQPSLTPPTTPAAPATAPAAPTYYGTLQGKALAQMLVPAQARDRAGWAADIADSVAALRLPGNAGNYCAAIAVIEQESSFQADPVVAGLPQIAWKEIEARRQRYHIPKLALNAALDRTSPDGRHTYHQRIDSLRTERQLSVLYGDIIDGVPGGKLLLSGYNPVHTGGPMQVSFEFAREHARDNAYAAALVRDNGGDVRETVFSRRGGVHFGTAHLLDYPASYTNAIYRFADFNAGRYASRNAAFQQALARISGASIALDGDLLDYDNGRVSDGQQAAQQITKKLGLANGEIAAALKLEKSEAFARTTLYQRVFELADQAAGRRVAREILPQIDLKSPKIHSKITTAWFAQRVDGRYRQCLQRASAATTDN